MMQLRYVCNDYKKHIGSLFLTLTKTFYSNYFSNSRQTTSIIISHSDLELSH